MQRDLENYAGKKVVIYVVAKATPNGSYLDSLPGITTEITVPDRLAAPKVMWSNNWQYDIDQSLAAADFRNGGMMVSVRQIGEHSTRRQYLSAESLYL